MQKMRGLLVVAFSLFFAVNAFAIRRVESVSARPALVFTHVNTAVRIVADIASDPDLIRTGVRAVLLDESGGGVRIAAPLFDDGNNGDIAANDNIFTGTFHVNELTPKTLRLQVSVPYRGTLLRLMSEIFTVSVTAPAFSTPPDPAKIVVDQGAVFPVNEIIVNLPAGSSLAVAQSIASSVGGTIVGFDPSSNAYTFRVQAQNVSALEALIALLKNDARVDGAGKNVQLSFEAVQNDLSSLRSQAGGPAKTWAYDRITFDTRSSQYLWDLLDKIQPVPFPVSVGIIDQPIDSTHPEFAGVNFGNSPADAFTSATPHGTGVAGIIGANNASAAGALPADSPQMNGLLAGWPSNTNASGSRIRYTIEARRSNLFLSDALAIVSQLATTGVRVINMSFGMNLCTLSDLSLCVAQNSNWHPISQAEYTSAKTLITDTISANSQIVFVASAGNANMTADNHIPGGGINLPNLITVGATNASEARASFSQFGSGVTLGAPGENIYAPSLFAAPLGGDDYQTSSGSGTSFAAPMVTGTVGLMFAMRETLKAEQISKILKVTGETIATDQPIGGKRLNAYRAVKYVAQPVDVFVLVDMTGSFFDDLTVFKAGASSMISDLVQSGVNVHFGLGRFEDFPINPWGDAGAGDRAYTRVLDVAPPEDFNSNGTIDILDAIQSLSTRSGLDGPESQLSALFYAATGAALDVFPAGPSVADIPGGQQANFRSKSLPLFVLWTDASFHKAGDSFGDVNGTSIPYPGPSEGETITALNAKGIKVIGIAAGGTIPDLRAVVLGTNTLAPVDVDCNNDTVIDVPAGQPLVCPISATGVGVSNAIVNAVLAFDVVPTP